MPASASPAVSRVYPWERRARRRPGHSPAAGASGTAAIAPPSAVLVAAHSWDIHRRRRRWAAHRLVQPARRAFPLLLTAPTVDGATLVDVVEQLARGSTEIG